MTVAHRALLAPGIDEREILVLSGHRMILDEQLATMYGVESLLASVGTLDLRGIHWVIVGGESGPGAREMSPEWVREVQRQCKRAGVPFFFKQWGGVGKSLNGRTLDRRTFSEMPQAARRLRPEARAD